MKNNEGLFANPADMRFHITDATGTELDGGTCSPEEQKLNPGEETTVIALTDLTPKSWTFYFKLRIEFYLFTHIESIPSNTRCFFLA